MSNKKDFGGQGQKALNAFFSQSTPSTNTPVKEELTEVKAQEEILDRRVQILTKPSTHEALKAHAKQKGTSVNKLINNVLEGFLENIK